MTRRLFPLFRRLAQVALGLVLATGCQENDAYREEVRYPNGSLRMIKTLTGDGVLHGRSVSFYPDGTRQSVSTWDHGRRTGITTLYDSAGTVRDSSRF